MIRREIQIFNQPPCWLLITQLEHARLCGVLAEHCLPEFDKPFRQELMQAIVHHDDGWADWELAPQIDPDHGRPYSFRELPLADSLAIWRKSINASAEYGNIAGWVVAQHFLALLGKGDSAHEETSIKWQDEITSLADSYFSTWQQADLTRNTKTLALEGLAWLQLLDMLSLWLCSVCAGAKEESVPDRESFLFAASNQQLETWCHFKQHHVSLSLIHI